MAERSPLTRRQPSVPAPVINAAGAGIDETGGVAGGGTKPIPATVFVSNTPETWNADLVYGGTRNMTIGDQFRLAPAPPLPAR